MLEELSGYNSLELAFYRIRVVTSHSLPFSASLSCTGLDFPSSASGKGVASPWGRGQAKNWAFLPPVWSRPIRGVLKEIDHVTGEFFFFFHPPLCLYHFCCP